MARSQDQECRDANGANSASPGDLDIAYALLLADKQWGSCGAHDYRAHARRVISAIIRGELHRDGRYVLLGDWVDTSQLRLYNATRPSDFVPGHFRSYQRFMGEAWWLGVIDNGYWLLETVQALESPEAGLLPDYVEDADTERPRAASPGLQNNDHAGRYSLFASGVPWRLGSDFLVSGDNRARRILSRINTFVRARTNDDPTKIPAGFTLDGEPNPGPGGMAFTAPLGVSAMVHAENQSWLDAVWQVVESTRPRDFRDATAQLVSMLLMSNNWWPPEYGTDPCIGR
jgi:hypothetical protein